MPGFVFRLPREYYGGVQLQVLVRLCERELDALTEQFGFRLRRPLTVIVLANTSVVRQVFGRPAGGFAVPSANAIVIAADYAFPSEIIRHELAHLFAVRRSTSALRPSLKSEGLAVWCQQTERGVPIDVAVIPHMGHQGLRLSALLTETSFWDGRYASYVVSGSFTGFLIRRYGWDAYRWFYHLADSQNFQRVFRRHFGMTLDEAEWHWRNELTGSTIMPSGVRGKWA